MNLLLVYHCTLYELIQLLSIYRTYFLSLCTSPLYQYESSVSTRLFLSSFRSLSSLTVSLRLHSLPLAVGTTGPREERERRKTDRTDGGSEWRNREVSEVRRAGRNAGRHE